ncbi:MAG: hypothetical protein HONBIEJF_01850 [Fimbriimonadaceae bacterium]|nr:hypothetical protein [Fimbriimonadaceae bacterium]
MINSRTLVIALATLVATASQAAVLWSQPWNPNQKWASFPSAVESCAVPNILGAIAMDDFRLANGGIVNRVAWWGVPLVTAQLAGGRKYYIAFYENTPGMCKPNAQPVFRACVTPQFVTAGIDCQGKVVYRFEAALGAPFNAVPNRHYWIQISEDDSTSATKKVIDWQWSGYRPINLCPSQSVRKMGALTKRFLNVDPCDGQKDDLAFQLIN